MKKSIILSLIALLAFSTSAATKTVYNVYKNNQLVKTIDAKDVTHVKAEDTDGVKSVKFYSLGVALHSFALTDIDYMDIAEVEDVKTVNFDIPDLDGYNVKGVVYCGDTPVEGVVVSDGTEVTTTDADGRYYLNSDKKRQYVFVSIPSGYTVDHETNFPIFYSHYAFDDVNVKEQHNFKLTEKPGNDYIVLALADMHVANIRDTPRQFKERFIPDVNATIASYRALGKEVYCVSLGDESHDKYWYANNLALGAAKPYFNMIDAPLFHCMGNHDNDPYYPDDFLSENTWRKELGPSYYSFNIGKYHYVVLDNIEYVNTGAKVGTLGDRSYNVVVTDNQIDWLKKDLAYVDSSTPIILCMHGRFFKKAMLSGNSQVTEAKYDLANHLALRTCLLGRNVTILTGHAHTNCSSGAGTIREYNIGAVNGALWYTGQDHFAKNHICSDGSVGGYFVMEIDNNSFTSYYKCMGYDRDYQFRTYDGNKTFIRKTQHHPNSSYSNKKAFDLFESKEPGCMTEWGGVWKDGAKNPVARTDNKVFVNVFAFDNRWKIEATDNGNPVEVKRINGFDPLFIISSACKCLENGNDKSKEEAVSAARLPNKNSHMFEIQASSATSTIEIKVTDQYGRVYTETMTRPKEFSTSMR